VLHLGEVRERRLEHPQRRHRDGLQLGLERGEAHERERKEDQQRGQPRAEGARGERGLGAGVGAAAMNGGGHGLLSPGSCR
jgi:hypothetical protein